MRSHMQGPKKNDCTHSSWGNAGHGTALLGDMLALQLCMHGFALSL